MTPGALTTWTDVTAFIFAGNATFTLRSIKTGVRFTYKVQAKKADVARRAQEVVLQREARDKGVILNFTPPTDVTFFINLLRGPDNESDFAYMGVLRKPGHYFWTNASGKVGRQAPAYKALLWMLDAMTCQRSVLGTFLEVWHEGKCGRCGRKLTVPESIEAGLGPECQLKVTS